MWQSAQHNVCVCACTLFTCLNTAATINHVLKLDVAAIKGRPLFEGGYYYHDCSMHCGQ